MDNAKWNGLRGAATCGLLLFFVGSVAALFCFCVPFLWWSLPVPFKLFDCVLSAAAIPNVHWRRARRVRSLCQGGCHPECVYVYYVYRYIR